MSVTIREVAQHAGVSVATVSRAFTGSGPVGVDTRERIERVARELRYVPNGAARSLTMSTTHTLGVLLPDLYGDFYSELLRGIDRAARRSHYHLLVSSTHPEDDDRQAALRAMSGRVDGLLVMSPDLGADALDGNLPRGLPVALLNGMAAGETFSAIGFDNAGGALRMVRHLLDHGHTHVAHVTGPSGNHDAAERLRGYHRALDERRLPADPGLLFTGDFTEASGYRAARALLGATPRPTAVFCANDAMAVGALRAVREAGLRVPADLAVTGFDDIPVARYLTPALTTVHVPIQEMGKQAVQSLLRALQPLAGAERRQTTLLPTRLVIRESCGAHS